MALARVIGGPASGITNEEAVEAARFRDDLKIQKCGTSRGLAASRISMTLTATPRLVNSCGSLRIFRGPSSSAEWRKLVPSKM